MGEIGTLFNFVRSNIRYIQDINNVETIRDPLATLQLGRGDCDDMVTLLSTLLETIGYTTKFVAIGFQAGYFDHVYLEVIEPDSGSWLALDPTEPNAMGWAADGYVCRIDYPVNGG